MNTCLSSVDSFASTSQRIWNFHFLLGAVTTGPSPAPSLIRGFILMLILLYKVSSHQCCLLIMHTFRRKDKKAEDGVAATPAPAVAVSIDEAEHHRAPAPAFPSTSSRTRYYHAQYAFYGDVNKSQLQFQARTLLLGRLDSQQGGWIWASIVGTKDNSGWCPLSYLVEVPPPTALTRSAPRFRSERIVFEKRFNLLIPNRAIECQ